MTDRGDLRDPTDHHAKRGDISTTRTLSSIHMPSTALSPQVSIVVANWNTVDLLRDLLRSLHAVPALQRYEIIVIDNGSTDGSGDMVSREFTSIVLFRNTRNLGYAAANNQGIRAATGEFILLLGSDTRVMDRSVERMAEYLASHPEVGALSCRLLYPDGSLQRSCRRFPRLVDGLLTYLAMERLAGRYNMLDMDYYATQEVDQPAATCLMVRRAVLSDIGAFDESLAILYNDVDLCERIWRKGWRIIFLADTEVIHHGSKSTRSATPELRLEMYRNILVYYWRRFGITAIALLLPVLGIRLLVLNRGRSVLGLFSMQYLNK